MSSLSLTHTHLIFSSCIFLSVSSSSCLISHSLLSHSTPPAPWGDFILGSLVPWWFFLHLSPDGLLDFPLKSSGVNLLVRVRCRGDLQTNTFEGVPEDCCEISDVVIEGGEPREETCEGDVWGVIDNVTVESVEAPFKDNRLSGCNCALLHLLPWQLTPLILLDWNSSRVWWGEVVDVWVSERDKDCLCRFWDGFGEEMRPLVVSPLALREKGREREKKRRGGR